VRTRSAPVAFGLLLVGALTLVPRLAALPLAREDNLTPDGARFLNIARCISRGQGFSTPEAWPAWMNPPRLPMPETFKEPGYPYAIAALAPFARQPFRAAQGVSLLAGLLIPLAVYRLSRRLDPDPAVALVAAALAAASPVLIRQSVYVMAESAMTLALTLAFLTAAPRVRIRPESGGIAAKVERAPAGPTGDFLAGVFFGLAFLVRAQGLLALPALAALLMFGGSWRARAARCARAGLGAAIAVTPLVVRNLRVFGTPFHSEVAAFGLWPYVDQFTLTHSLDRPPAPLGFALAHPAQVAGYFLGSLARLVRYSLPHDLLGSALWLVPLAIGVVVAWRRRAVWGFTLLYLAPTGVFILSLNWVARYLASVVPFLALLTALGTVALARRVVPRSPAAWRARAAAAGLAALAAVALGLQATRTARSAAPDFAPELDAARHEAEFLRTHLMPDEAVMAELTSYWAYYSDRAAVYPVVADSARFLGVIERLRVRYAALPTSRLAEFAARYPGGRLPAALQPDHQDPARDVTVFRVRPLP
jgi:4-amino-4-deoxy-L-arabinose transferase-like glycosyltransferase